MVDAMDTVGAGAGRLGYGSVEAIDAELSVGVCTDIGVGDLGGLGGRIVLVVEVGGIG
jgi:hypothetical protein